MATATRGTPSGAARVTGRKGNGTTRWITVPETSEIRNTSGGRRRPRFATSRDALEAPPCCGVVVTFFGPAKPIDRLRRAQRFNGSLVGAQRHPLEARVRPIAHGGSVLGSVARRRDGLIGEAGKTGGDLCEGFFRAAARGEHDCERDGSADRVRPTPRSSGFPH